MLPGRTGHDIKNRYHAIQRRIKLEEHQRADNEAVGLAIAGRLPASSAPGQLSGPPLSAPPITYEGGTAVAQVAQGPVPIGPTVAHHPGQIVSVPTAPLSSAYMVPHPQGPAVVMPAGAAPSAPPPDSGVPWPPHPPIMAPAPPQTEGWVAAHARVPGVFMPPPTGPMVLEPAQAPGNQHSVAVPPVQQPHGAVPVMPTMSAPRPPTQQIHVHSMPAPMPPHYAPAAAGRRLTPPNIMHLAAQLQAIADLPTEGMDDEAQIDVILAQMREAALSRRRLPPAGLSTMLGSDVTQRLQGSHPRMNDAELVNTALTSNAALAALSDADSEHAHKRMRAHNTPGQPVAVMQWGAPVSDPSQYY